MSKRDEKNKGIYIIGAVKQNIETGEIEEYSKIIEGNPEKAFYEMLDAENHEYTINKVKSYNDMVKVGKKRIINYSSVLAFFGLVDAYNLHAIFNGENNLGIINYLIAGVCTYVSIAAILEIIKTILVLLVSKNFGKSGNEFFLENYPDEADKVNMPKRLIKTIKKKQNEKEES